MGETSGSRCITNNTNDKERAVNDVPDVPDVVVYCYNYKQASHSSFPGEDDDLKGHA